MIFTDLWEFLPDTARIFILIDGILFCLAIYMRSSLYKSHQNSLRKLNEVVKNDNPNKDARIDNWIKLARDNYEKASQKLESVNTSALVDQVYSQQQLPFFLTQGISYEQVDLFLKITPDILLSIGLFGTFWGMIANLSNLSTTFTLNTSERLATNPDNFAELLISISPSLESMGTAFSSSLVGLGFNLLLTGLVYLIWDTNFSKNQLLSTVEHYLDNIVQPSIDGKSRFDKAVGNYSGL